MSSQLLVPCAAAAVVHVLPVAVSCKECCAASRYAAVLAGHGKVHRIAAVVGRPMQIVDAYQAKRWADARQ